VRAHPAALSRHQAVHREAGGRAMSAHVHARAKTCSAPATQQLGYQIRLLLRRTETSETPENDEDDFAAVNG
jgi:hypothetical protein